MLTDDEMRMLPPFLQKLIAAKKAAEQDENAPPVEPAPHSARCRCLGRGRERSAIEDAPPELTDEAARALVKGPTLAAVVESDTPLPAVRSPREKLGDITGQALDKLAEVLGMSREEVLVHPQFERLIAWAKLQLSATEIAMRTQLKADEGALKAAAVDPWPKLQARWEAAKKEAAGAAGVLCSGGAASTTRLDRISGIRGRWRVTTAVVRSA